MAFPTFVGHGGAVQETTTTLTVVNNASAATGDYEVLIIETQNEAVTLTTTGGFTAFPGNTGSGAGIYPSPNATATLATRLTVFERIFSGQADPVTNDPGNHVIANIFTFRKSSGTWSSLDDVRSTTQGTGWQSNTQDADTTSASMTGITTDTADQLICGFTAAAKPDVAGGTAEMGTVTNTNLASITERHDDAAASGNGGWIGAWTGQEATSGQAIGASTWTKTTTSQMAHLILGIRDAAPGGGPTETPKDLVVTATYTVALPRQVNKAIGIGSTMAVALSKQVGKVIALGSTLTVALVGAVAYGKALAINATYTVALATATAFGKTLEVAATYTVGLVKQAGKVMDIPVTYTVGLVKQVGKALPIGATYTVVMVPIRVFLKSLEVAATYTVALVKQAGKQLPVTFTTTFGLVKHIGFQLVTLSTYEVAFTKAVRKTMAVTATMTAALSRSTIFQKALAVTVALVPSLGSVYQQFIDVFNAGKERYPGPLWYRKGRRFK